MPCRKAELVATYAERLWDAWKEYEKRHGALSGVRLAARVEERIGEPFNDSKLSRVRSGKRRATVEELVALSEELEVPFLWLATGKRENYSLPIEVGNEEPAERPKKRLKRKGA